MRVPRPRLPHVPGLLRWLLVLVSAAALVMGAAASPRWLRRSPAFKVQRVEIAGTHWLDAQDVLAASGIRRTNSVFDDPAPWRAKLLRLPLVQDVSIQRRLPSTLLVQVKEAEPVALARTPELVPVTGTGAVLPIRAGAELDLPLVGVDAKVGADGRLATRAAVQVAATLERVRALDPELAAMVSEAQPVPGSAVRLVLRAPLGLEALIPADPSADGLRHLRAALADVTARGELPRLRRLDGRFTDQIVVAFNTQRP